jgi:hypothetical protein
VLSQIFPSSLSAVNYFNAARIRRSSMAEPVTRRGFVARSTLLGAVVVGREVEAEGTAAAESQSAQAGASYSTEPPDQLIRRMMMGFQLTQLVYVAAKLRIADHLASGPRTVKELAATTKTHADSLYRVLRTLAGFGVFAEEEGHRFRLTPAAEFLRTGVPGSLRAAVEVRGEDWTWRAWGALIESVRTGKTGFDLAYGLNTFEWFSQHPAAARLFDEFQGELTARSAGAVVAAYDFSGAGVVADIGGGNGTLLAAILDKSPGTRGILFDLPHVIDAAKKTMPAAVARRCEFVGGDFFKAVPAGADIYVVKHILHDWNDERAQAILTRCRDGMSASAKLLVIEDLVCAPNVLCDAKVGDVNMLARTGGRNRTDKEYRDLLAAGGFTVRRVLPASRDLAVLEALAT